MALSTYVKELFGRIALQMVDSNADDVALVAEDSGTPKFVMYGKDSSSNEDPLRTNASQQLQVEVVSGIGGSSYKVLGSSAPSAATETTLYTTPASTTTKVEKIVVCNKSSATTFVLGQAVAGGSLDSDEFWFEDTVIEANQTLMIDGPFYLATTDLLRCESASGNVAFTAWGIEWA